MQDSGNEKSKKKFYDPVTKQLFDLLLIKAKSYFQNKKIKKQVSKTNAQKQTSLPNKIFDYIYKANFFSWLGIMMIHIIIISHCLAFIVMNLAII